MELTSKDTDESGTLPQQLRSPRAKLVYLYLKSKGKATISEMSEALGMKKLALFSVLKNLQRDELIDHSEGLYTP
ncbi:MAG: hypothetical protein A07HR60_02761, partial [uncultured archaeon A07HR60]